MSLEEWDDLSTLGPYSHKSVFDLSRPCRCLHPALVTTSSLGVSVLQPSLAHFLRSHLSAWSLLEAEFGFPSLEWLATEVTLSFSDLSRQAAGQRDQHLLVPPPLQATDIFLGQFWRHGRKPWREGYHQLFTIYFFMGLNKSREASAPQCNKTESGTHTDSHRNTEAGVGQQVSHSQVREGDY